MCCKFIKGWREERKILKEIKKYHLQVLAADNGSIDANVASKNLAKAENKLKIWREVRLLEKEIQKMKDKEEEDFEPFGEDVIYSKALIDKKKRLQALEDELSKLKRN